LSGEQSVLLGRWRSAALLPQHPKCCYSSKTGYSSKTAFTPRTFSPLPSHCQISVRKCSSESEGPIIPPLMDFPEIHLPKITNSIRNKFLSATLIRPYFDSEFNIPDFIQGAKLAAEVVSQSLATGDLENLDETCTQDCLNTVTKNLSLFSMRERAELNLTADDIYYGFLYQIGILMDDEPDREGNYGRSVECTWVGHAYKDYVDLVLENNSNPMRIKDVLEENGGPTILNFRFIRGYTKGKEEDSWTINALNYYKLYDSL